MNWKISGMKLSLHKRFRNNSYPVLHNSSSLYLIHLCKYSVCSIIGYIWVYLIPAVDKVLAAYFLFAVAGYWCPCTTGETILLYPLRCVIGFGFQWCYCQLTGWAGFYLGRYQQGVATFRRTAILKFCLPGRWSDLYSQQLYCTVAAGQKIEPVGVDRWW